MKALQTSKEPELISWDEVEQQKDIYQAITTADGRQALVKASSGKLSPPLVYLGLYWHRLWAVSVTCVR